MDMDKYTFIYIYIYIWIYTYITSQKGRPNNLVFLFIAQFDALLLVPCIPAFPKFPPHPFPHFSKFLCHSPETAPQKIPPQILWVARRSLIRAPGYRQDSICETLKLLRSSYIIGGPWGPGGPPRGTR